MFLFFKKREEVEKNSSQNDFVIYIFSLSQESTSLWCMPFVSFSYFDRSLYFLNKISLIAQLRYKNDTLKKKKSNNTTHKDQRKSYF